MKLHTRTCLAALASLALVSGCNRPKEPKIPEGAASGSLASEIQVNPDLIGKASEGATQVSADKNSPEAIAAAKTAALQLVGGRLQTPPTGGSAAASQPIATAAARLSGGPANCGERVAHAKDWANKVPAAFSAYPHSEVIDAAGVNANGCDLRIVNFVTPVGVDDVMGYYYTRIKAAGLDPTPGVDGSDKVLGGHNDKAAFLLYARRLNNGLTEVDVMVTGA